MLLNMILFVRIETTMEYITTNPNLIKNSLQNCIK